jgi:phage tail sheath protein FI
MPSALSYPGVYIEEISSGVRTITGVATSITLFIGWAPRGPVDKAVRISNVTDYDRTFGGLDARSPLSYAVRHFFGNGGGDAYIVRLVSGAAPSGATIGDLIIRANSPGLWANEYAVSTTQLLPGGTRFKLSVLNKKTNAVVESFPNLSVDSRDPRYVESAINDRSKFITVSVTPADKDKDPVVPSDTVSDLAGGNDGKTLEPNTDDFHAALEDSFGIGSITDRIDLFNIVCVPGETHPAAIAKVQQHCHARRAFLIVDADPNAIVASLNASGGADAALTGTYATNSALYFPWVQAPDPLQQGALKAYPPCGFVAGVFARTDATRGVWKAPAGSDASLNGAMGFAIPMSDAENGWLNPLAINCLRTRPVYGNVVWGARTLQGQTDRGSEWNYIPVRRTALFIEESLFRGTQWVVFEPNDEPLWAQIRLNIGAFMHSLFRQGAFQGQTPKDAYFVKCDKETTTQDDINRGIVNIVVGFAPLKPAEFVVIQLQQIAGDIQT